MSSFRTGPIFTQEVLQQLKQATQPGSNIDEEDETTFREKTQALQKFLHHGMARFSIESFRHVLDELTHSNSDNEEVPASIRSVGDIRTLVRATVMKRETGSIKSSDADSLIYLENIFYAIFCLTEVKKIFDEIYGDLFYSYYNPDDFSRQATLIHSSQPRRKGHEGDAEDYSQFGISTLDQMTGSAQHKLKQTVQDMNEVLSRWSNILTDKEPLPDDFDPESEQDLLIIRSSSRAGPILRLLPDIFAKFYKCLELSKQWWVLAHEIYPDLPLQRQPSVSEQSIEENRYEEVTLSGSLSDESSHLSTSRDGRTEREQAEIAQAKQDMKDSTDVLKALEEELEALEKREAKFEILQETYETVEKDIALKRSERQALWSQREQLRHTGKNNELFEVENDIRKYDNALKLLEFQHALLLQDYIIHTEIRPSIIRFHGNVVTRVQEARTLLDQQVATLERLVTGNHPQDNNSESVSVVSSVNSRFEADSINSRSRSVSIQSLNSNHSKGYDSVPSINQSRRRKAEDNASSIASTNQGRNDYKKPLKKTSEHSIRKVSQSNNGTETKDNGQFPSVESKRKQVNHENDLESRNVKNIKNRRYSADEKTSHNSTNKDNIVYDNNRITNSTAKVKASNDLVAGKSMRSQNVNNPNSQNKTSESQQGIQESLKKDIETQQRAEAKKRILESHQRIHESQRKTSDSQQRAESQKKVLESQQKIPESQKKPPDFQKKTSESQKKTTESQQRAEPQKKAQESHQVVPVSQKKASESQQRTESQKRISESQQRAPGSQAKASVSRESASDSQKKAAPGANSTSPDTTKSTPTSKGETRLTKQSPANKSLHASLPKNVTASQKPNSESMSRSDVTPHKSQHEQKSSKKSKPEAPAFNRNAKEHHEGK